MNVEKRLNIATWIAIIFLCTTAVLSFLYFESEARRVELQVMHYQALDDIYAIPYAIASDSYVNMGSLWQSSDDAKVYRVILLSDDGMGLTVLIEDIALTYTSAEWITVEELTQEYELVQY